MPKIPAEPLLFTPQPKRRKMSQYSPRSERKLPIPLYSENEFKDYMLNPHNLKPNFNCVVKSIVSLSFGIEHLDRVKKQINEYLETLQPINSSMKQIVDLILVAARSPFVIIEILFNSFFKLSEKVTPDAHQISLITESFNDYVNDFTILYPNDFKESIHNIQSKLKLYCLDE
ncbi:hypothetical protein TVAG_444340 [Trichomonas vaginalis G3]|uniref:Uncharacterized protein n=1 Tax=Trichomonas vaginalis (strain ATCC PRA-98 / G3) TaxID=412133 RepID=A2E2H5_TRIV3|nr:hypothetical protein TVAGG3_0306100 [Trichomonas vaginalis G3]EAY13150.1 hypothetical protein TVAG_444340 [Trichomonas vaginalis G3]KAI5528264.1 hypothetical protein TVAGG3_0306100 [Trichomonas vaginalis G3]|eukprot:XP_001325373.1 hypothetical protein [Trichomonas vaginalis G3]